jgi:uncharacterized protein YjbI with pentapeptide repeats
VITAQGTEAISFGELERRLEDNHALIEWAEDVVSENTLHELVVNFYFRSHAELGCEFLHKSFREYLFAEAVVGHLADAGGLLSASDAQCLQGGEDFPRGSVRFDLSRSLARLLASQWLTPDVRTHIFRLLDDQVGENTQLWTRVRGLLRDLYSWWAHQSHLLMHREVHRGRVRWRMPAVIELLEDALPLDDRIVRSSQSMRRADAILGNALIQLAAYLHWLLRACPVSDPCSEYQTELDGVVVFAPLGGLVLDLVARLTYPEPPDGFGLAGLVLPGVDLRNADLRGVDLRAVDLRDAHLDGVDLQGSRLNRADLRGAVLTRGVLRQTDMQGIQLENANLAGADLRWSNLEHANLKFAEMSRAHLQRSNLQRANLREAKLGGAHLQHADLQLAGFDAADLHAADLREADLRHANLATTTLTDASLDDALTDGADMPGTTFRTR